MELRICAATDIFGQIRPQAAPNRLIFKLADIIFNNSDNQLFKLADELCSTRFQNLTDNKI